MSPGAWQAATCLPAILCEGCEDVAQARDYLCAVCRGELEALVARDSRLTQQDRGVERFLASARRIEG